METYNFCKYIWKQEKMTCLRDFLIWYNNLDVAPFVSEVLRLEEFYFGRNIDIFKTAKSVPGIARYSVRVDVPEPRFRCSERRTKTYSIP